MLGRLKDIDTSVKAGPVLPAPTPLLAAAVATGDWVGPITGGEYIWAARATWNSTVATLEVRLDDGVTAMSTGAILSANGGKLIKVGNGSYLRVALAGGTTTGITSTLSKVQ